MPLLSSGYFYGLVSSFFGGFTVIAAKYCVDIGQIAASVYVFFISLFAAILTIFTLIFQRKTPFLLASKKSFFILGMHSFLAAIALGSVTHGIRLMDPSAGSFLSRMETVFVLLIAVFFLGEKITKASIFGFFLSFFGVFIMKNPFNFMNMNPESLAFFHVLFGAFCYSGAETCAKLSSNEIPALYFACYRATMMCLFTGLFNLFFQIPFSADFKFIGIMALAAFTGPFLARLFFQKAFQSLNLSTASILSLTQPLFTVICAKIILGSQPEWMEIFGGLMILGGCLILILQKSKTSKNN